MRYSLQNPHTVEYYAAVLEAEQANRDYRETFRAFHDGGRTYGSPSDYAVWSAAGYANTAERRVRDMRIWEN